MKTFLCIFALALALSVGAQTNLPVSAPTNTSPASATGTNAPAEPSPIDIKSEHCVLDWKNLFVVYSSHVVVTFQQMSLTCDTLRVEAPTNSTHLAHPQKGIAEGNVKIVGRDKKDQPFHTQCDQAIYDYTIISAVTNGPVVTSAVTNETITLTGNVYVDSAMGKGTAEPVVVDCINRTIHLENQNMQIQPEIKSGTNAAPLKLF